MSARARVMWLRIVAAIRAKWPEIVWGLMIAFFFLVMREFVAAFVVALYGVTSAIRDFMHEREVDLLTKQLTRERSRR